jgi:VWFA-related protein
VTPLALVAALALAASPPAGQTEAGRQEAEPPAAFRADTQLVVLDVVARDKKGKTVRDLAPGEIQVLEEGVPRPIRSLRFVETPAAPTRREDGGAAAPAVPAPESIRNPTLVTLVFDALSPEARLFARTAALELLDLEERPDVVVSVFVIGQRLRLLQQFTNDRVALRAAVERACRTIDPRGPTPDAAAVDRAADAAQTTADAADSAGGGAAGAAATVAAMFANLELRAVRMAEDLERGQRGNASLFGLFALARQQQRLSGRKAIVYFSEGLDVPLQLVSVFRSVVSEANRANLSVYAVDARGLRSRSDFDRTRTDLRDAAETSRRQVQSRGGRAVTREDVLAPEVAEAAINLNVQGQLGALAEETGGRLIANSNDVRAGLERAVDDLSGYYEITYDPQLVEFDGRFRRVELKVARPGVRVQTRAGYFALPPGEGAVNFPWELPLLKTLQASPAPHDFDLRAATFHFGPEDDAVRLSLVAEIPIESLSFDEKGGTRHAHFSLMAVVRDAKGVVQERFSQDSPLEVPEKSLEALRHGSAVFTRSFRLPPGRYSLEMAVLDEATKKATVRRSVLVVAPPRAGLGLSSLAVVKRVEPVAERALDSADPLRTGPSRVVPFVGEPTFRAGDTVSLFLVAYPRPGAGGEPSLTLEFARDGAVVARSSAALPAADSEGRIPYVASVPSRSLAPGRYEVEALVQQGEATVRESTFFTIAAN